MTGVPLRRRSLVEFTGERLVPGQVDQDLYNEHISRYCFAARLARNKRVLDIACGMGYGSAELAHVATRVVGMDVSDEAVQAASALYQAPNLQFITAPAQHIPFEDQSFDLIVAFEVIEHLSDWPALLEEARRLLAPGGQFIVSTPNVEYYAETRRLAGPNPYHVHEFQYEEFRTELNRFFPSVTMFLQNHVEAISFHPSVGGGTVISGMSSERTAPQPESSHFFLAVCALSQQTGSPVYLYVPSSSNVLRERERHIAKLEGELQRKDQWLEELKADHAKLHDAHEEQRAELEKSAAWAVSLDGELEGSRQRVVELQQELETHQREALETAAAYEVRLREVEAELVERTNAITQIQQRLEADLQDRIAELAKCVDLLHEAEKTVEERTLWAQSLGERVSQLEQTLQGVQGSRWVRMGRRLGIGPDLQKY
jgi:ubiquinone/menaquinone biosynthesis C-methylase UbiE